MSRFPRPVLGLVLLAGLATSARAAEVESILPAETEGVLSVNVRQVLDSDIVKKYALGQVKQALAGDENQKTLQRLGLDPLKDIDRLTVGFWGKTPQDMKALAVLRGKFNPDKLNAAAVEEAKTNKQVAVVTEGDVKLIKVTPKDDKEPMYSAVANEGTVVSGNDPKMVAAAYGAAQKKGKPALKKELAALVTSQDEKASVYVCGLASGKVDVPPVVQQFGVDPDKLAKQLGTMTTFALTLRVTEDADLEIDLGMKDEDSADEFKGTVDQLLGTAKLGLGLIGGQPQFQPAKPAFDELSKTLRSKVKNKDVVVTAKVSSGTIAKAVGGGNDK